MKFVSTRSMHAWVLHTREFKLQNLTNPSAQATTAKMMLRQRYRLWAVCSSALSNRATLDNPRADQPLLAQISHSWPRAHFEQSICPGCSGAFRAPNAKCACASFEYLVTHYLPIGHLCPSRTLLGDYSRDSVSCGSDETTASGLEHPLSQQQVRALPPLALQHTQCCELVTKPC